MHTFDRTAQIFPTLYEQKKKVPLSNTPHGVNINKLKVPFKVKGYIYQRFNSAFMYKG